MFYDLRFIQNDVVIDPQEQLKIVCANISRGYPQYEVEYTEFSGSNGSRESNASFKPFSLFLDLDVFFNNDKDAELIETELYSLIFIGTPYYLIHSKSPGKRFKVNPVSLEREDEYSSYTRYKAEFLVFEGHSEAVSTTLSNYSLDNEWQFSQGILADDYEYTFNQNKFIVYNAGDFTIDPREQDLIIKVEGMSDGKCTLFNKTTGERFIYNGSIYSDKGEALTIEGVYPKKNGVHCGIETNHGLISLVPGKNEIEIQNISRMKVSFDFRFLYK
ncbi:hypothetical protein IGI37_000107 [Enterococcus sp. AZ194]|uniref:phage tail domain-containing protein n=1 Tax=Enterococcus sp. AZ194 TaxID=2774629 RepID=UPI003F2384C7